MRFYEVTSESKDGHLYTMTCMAESIRDAIVSSNREVVDKGWDHHQYVAINSKIIDPTVNDTLKYEKTLGEECDE